LVFEEHAEFLEELAVFKEVFPVHVVEPLINILPKMRKKIFILNQNIIFIVIGDEIKVLVVICFLSFYGHVCDDLAQLCSETAGVF